MFGRLLMTLGVVVLLFIGYELWGTGLREAASQRNLRAQFDAADPPPAGERQPVEALPTAPPRGNPVAILKIPKLGLDKVVVEGTDVASLKKGPGHEPGTPLPGTPGNAVIAGHRTTYRAPFYRLDELAPDDRIIVQTPWGEANYTVTGSQVVQPEDVWILEHTGDDRLTLYTCTPRFSAARRLVVTALLTEPPAAWPARPAAEDIGGRNEGATVGPGRQPPAVDELATSTASLAAAAVWSAATIVLAAAVWWGRRRYGRLMAYALGGPVLAITLFMTFERVGALLPSAI